jgi:glyoxylase-like metal-dependent hydrolase (beta-lactamase superfamily II)
MTEVKILLAGYAREENGVWFASPTTVLIYNSGLYTLVDPGVNKTQLIQALAQEGLNPEAIDIIFLTHYHLDHILNIRLFPDQDIYDGSAIHREDKIIAYSGNIPNTTIQVLPTPGHAPEHCSLLIDTLQGKVGIAGDVFWWMDHEEQQIDRESLLHHTDPMAKDSEELRKSRETLLALADFIIPGHGKPFTVAK